MSTAKEMLDAMVDEMAEFIDVERDDFAGFLADQQIELLTAEFLATQNTHQLAIIGFRLRTWARGSTVRAIRKSAAQLNQLIVALGRIAVKAIAVSA